MKRLLGMLITLFSMYFIFQFVFLYFGGGHTLEYELNINGKNAHVVETLNQNQKGEVDNYYIEVDVDGLFFDFQVFEKYYGRARVLEDVHFYDGDNYSCLFPVFNNGEILKDMKCYDKNNGFYYNSLDIVNEDSDLATFIISLDAYNEEVFDDDLSDPIREGRLSVFHKNLIENHFVGVSSTRGLYTISHNNLSKIVEVPLFGSDVYTRGISTTVENYYVVANYDNRNYYKNLITIDLTNNRKDEISFRNDVSFESYFQGVRNSSLYLFDKDESAQYRIRLDNNNVSEVGNVQTGLIMYEGNELVDRIDAFEAIQNDIVFEDFIKIEDDYFSYKYVHYNLNSGYKYYVKENNNNYSIYRSSVQNKDSKKFIVNVDDLDRVIINNEFVYYVNGDEIKYYSDATSIRTLIRSGELSFNKSTYIGVYIR